MIDIPYTEVTATLVAYCLFVYCLVCLLFFKKAINKKYQYSMGYNKSVVFLAFLFLLSVVTFCLSGDYFTYQQIVKEYNPRIPSYGEAVYHHIIGFVNKNYLLFRIVVWGGAEFIAYQTFKRFHTNKFLSLFILYVLFIKTFFYARASLAMALYFWGLSFIIRPFLINGTKLISKLIGVSIVVSSFLFHSSMAICILATIIILIPINKNTVRLIIVFILLILLNVNFLQTFVQSSILGVGNDYIINKMSGYSIKETETFNIIGCIRTTIDYCRFYLPLLFIFLCFIEKKNKIILSKLKYANNLFKVTVLIILISAFTVLLGIPNNVLFYRILYCSMIPITILLSLLYSNNLLSKRKLKICLYLGIFVHVSDYIYAIAFYSF